MTRVRVAVLLATVFFAGVTPVVSTEAAGPVTFRSADVSPLDAPSVQAVIYMDKLIRERTGGRLSIASFGQNNKDSESYTVDQVRNGMIDMARINIAVLGRAVPSTSVLSLPY